MRVIINQMAAAGKKTGVGHYAAQLFHHLRLQAGADRVESYPGVCLRQARKAWVRLYPYLAGGACDTPPDPEARFPFLPWRDMGLNAVRGVGRSLLSRRFRKVFHHRRYDLYHEPNFLPLPNDFPTVATFHDLSVLLHPEWHPADRVAHFEHHLPNTLSQCVHFLTGSEFSRQEVIRTLNVPAGRVTRVYYGIRSGLRPLGQREVAGVLRRLGLPPRYLLYLGTIEPRKNVLRLLRAYCDLPERLRSRWPLLLVGGWGWKFLETAEFLYNEARHRGVIHLGYVADRHLPVLYSGARALLYPSLYEGFGLPPLEMMACGGAVLTSTAGALVETAGAHAHLIDPEDNSAWRDAMARVVQDDDWWNGLRRGVTQAARAYTWETCARETWEVYRSLVGMRPAALEPPSALPAAA